MKKDSTENYATELQSILIKTADLDTCQSLWQLMLGYPPIWQGRHGAASGAVFNVSNIKVEIYQFDSEPNGGDQSKNEPDGIYGLCFTDLEALKTKDADDVCFEAKQDGSIIECRQLQLDLDRSRQVSLFIRDRDIFALPDFEMIARTSEQVTKIDHVVLRTHDTQAVKKIYGDALGIRLALEQDVPKWGGTMLFYRSAHMSIEIISNAKTDATRDNFWGVAFTCADIDAVHARLLKKGEAAELSASEIRDGRKPGTRVSTVKGIAIPTLLIGESVKTSG